MSPSEDGMSNAEAIARLKKEVRQLRSSIQQGAKAACTCTPQHDPTCPRH